MEMKRPMQKGKKDLLSGCQMARFTSRLRGVCVVHCTGSDRLTAPLVDSRPHNFYLCLNVTPRKTERGKWFQIWELRHCAKWRNLFIFGVSSVCIYVHSKSLTKESIENT